MAFLRTNLQFGGIVIVFAVFGYCCVAVVSFDLSDRFPYDINEFFFMSLLNRLSYCQLLCSFVCNVQFFFYFDLQQACSPGPVSE